MNSSSLLLQILHAFVIPAAFLSRLVSHECPKNQFTVKIRRLHQPPFSFQQQHSLLQWMTRVALHKDPKKAAASLSPSLNSSKLNLANKHFTVYLTLVCSRNLNHAKVRIQVTKSQAHSCVYKPKRPLEISWQLKSQKVLVRKGDCTLTNRKILKNKDIQYNCAEFRRRIFLPCQWRNILKFDVK